MRESGIEDGLGLDGVEHILGRVVNGPGVVDQSLVVADEGVADRISGPVGAGGAVELQQLAATVAGRATKRRRRKFGT